MPYNRWLPSGSWRNLPDRSTPTSAEFFEHVEDSLEAVYVLAEAAGGGTGVTDGDKGDVTVSDTGDTWLVNASHSGSTHAAIQAAAEATAAADATTKANTAEANAIAAAAADATTKANTAESNAEATAANADNITSGTLAVARTHADIARLTQVTTAVSDHAAAVDPHGDRAYTDDEINDLSSLEDAPAPNDQAYLDSTTTPGSTYVRLRQTPRIAQAIGITAGVHTTTTPSTLLQSTITPPAGSVAAGTSVLEFKAMGTALNNVGTTRIIILRIMAGAVEVGGVSISLTTSASTRNWVLEASGRFTSAGGGRLAALNGYCHMGPPGFVGTTITNMIGGTFATIDPNAWPALDLTVEHDSASASLITIATILHVRRYTDA